jgi:hypothetical protein
VLTRDIPLEKAIEKKFVGELKKLAVEFKIDLKCRKMNGLGNASWPDRLIIGPKGFIMWVELKRPKIGKLSEGQKDLFADMASMGHPVQVHDDARLAILAVKYALHNAGVILIAHTEESCSSTRTSTKKKP